MEKMDTYKQANEARDIIAGTPIMPETAFEIGFNIGRCEGLRQGTNWHGNREAIEKTLIENAQISYDKAAKLMEEARNG